MASGVVQIESGWARPEGYHQYHYFRDRQITSVCARSMHSVGRRFEGDSDGPDKCHICMRLKDQPEVIGYRGGKAVTR